MNDFTTGGLIGALLAAVIVGLVAYLLRQRDGVAIQRTVDALQAQVVDLRQERTEDKEVNRQLRRDLAARQPVARADAGSSSTSLSEIPESSDPGGSSPEPTAADRALIERVAELEMQLARRSAALKDYQVKAAQFDAQMSARDDQLRRYREGLAELKAALEARDHRA